MPGAVADAEPCLDWLAAKAEANPNPLGRFRADNTAVARAGRDDYRRWLSHVHSAAGCSQPIRLAGRFRRVLVDTTTGETTPAGETSTADLPDGVIYKACGNRRAAVCESCAEIYRADAYQLVAAGLKGGKGSPRPWRGIRRCSPPPPPPGLASSTPPAPPRKASPHRVGPARPPTLARMVSTNAA